MRNILQHSQRENLAEYKCADRVAEKRIAEISRLRGRTLRWDRRRPSGRSRG
jgi:hypothetical protein